MEILLPILIPPFLSQLYKLIRQFSRLLLA
jgi:hypothetical protein